jgi:hypothetical protein
MDRPSLSIEKILWVVVLVLAFAVRFINLGAQPLADQEAGYALQALAVFPGTADLEEINYGSQSGYVAISGLLFWVFGSNESIARLLSALAGTLLCLSPFYFRNWLGRHAALIMGLGLALDPGLVAISRLAGGPMPALGFLLLGLGLLAAGRVAISGVFLGLALLAGPAAWQGAVIIAISVGLARLAESAGWITSLLDSQGEKSGIFPPVANWKDGLLYAGLTILLVGTVFGRFPQGLGLLGVSIPDYLSGWLLASSVTGIQMLAVLLAYQPLAIIFGIIGGVRGWADRHAFAQRVVIWVLVALLAVFLYPGRQMGDLIWVLTAFWALAAIELARYLEVESSSSVVVFGQSVLVFVMLCLFWLNLAGFNQSLLDQRGYWLRIGILLGVLFLVALTTFLLGYGWSWKAAVQGLVWGVVAGLVVYQAAGIWSSSRPATAQLLNIWHPSPQSGENRLLMETVQDFSKANSGAKDQIDVVVAVNSPSLRWSFRNFPNVEFITEQEVSVLGISPSLIITQVNEQNPALAASYRGQDLPWWRMPGWSGVLPQDLPSWLAYRKHPAILSSVILWARGDLFPGGSIPDGDTASSPDSLDIPLEEGLP